MAHTTHFDDCGCSTENYLRELKDFEEKVLLREQALETCRELIRDRDRVVHTLQLRLESLQKALTAARAAVEQYERALTLQTKKLVELEASLKAKESSPKELCELDPGLRSTAKTAAEQDMTLVVDPARVLVLYRHLEAALDEAARLRGRVEEQKNEPSA